MGPVVVHGEVGGERVARRLDDGPEEREGAEAGGVGVEGGADLLVNAGEERLVGLLHDPGQVHQYQSHRFWSHFG